MRLAAPILVSFAAATFSGCITPRSQQPHPGGVTAAQPAEKAGSKSDAATPNAPATPDATPASPAATADAPPKLFTHEELMTFIKRQVQPEQGFNPGDRELVGSLPKSPASGSVEEAALALGLVKSALYPVGQDGKTFIESDTSGAPRTVPLAKDANALEHLCKERDMNLADALIQNPMLQSYGVARQVYLALSRPGNSKGFRGEIVNALRGRAGQWAVLAGDLDQPITDAETGLPPVANATPSAPPSAESAGEDLPPDPAAMRGDDSVLAEAQALADRGDFKAAIKKTDTIGRSSPLYAAAQDKARDFANRGVQDLRKKAAAAFQSAMPISERKTRAQYLQQAKTYLEEAITNYPQATQLPTVRDNLRVISKDLERLQTEG